MCARARAPAARPSRHTSSLAGQQRQTLRPTETYILYSSTHTSIQHFRVPSTLGQHAHRPAAPTPSSTHIPAHCSVHTGAVAHRRTNHRSQITSNHSYEICKHTIRPGSSAVAVLGNRGRETLSHPRRLPGHCRPFPQPASRRVARPPRARRLPTPFHPTATPHGGDERSLRPSRARSAC